MMAAMAKILFRNRMNYSRWLVIGTIIALGVLSLSLFTGEVGPLFAVMGGGWLVVLALVAIVIQLAGGRQVSQLSQDGPQTLVMESNGLTGFGLPRVLPIAEISNWRWLSQGSNSQQRGPKLGMMAFDHDKKTYRLPMTTAKAIDIEGLRALAPEAVDGLIAHFPALRSLPLP